MKVLIFSSSYIPVIGGLQTVLNDLSVGLKEAGHTIIVLTNKYPLNLPAFQRIHEIPVLRIPLVSVQSVVFRSRPIRYLFFLILQISNYAYLVVLYLLYRPDIINIHFPDHQIPYLRALSAVFRNSKIITSIHGDDVQRFEDPARFDVKHRWDKRKASLLELLVTSDSIIVCSQYMRTVVTRLFPNLETNIEVIPNGLRKELRGDQSMPITASIPSQAYILTYGRLTHKKGFDMLLAAYSRVCSHQSNVPQLVISGDGPDLSMLKEQACTYGLDNSVIFTGALEWRAIELLLQRCCFAIFPSRIEPFGMVAIESMRAGKPVILTDVGGFREIAENTDIILVSAEEETIGRSLTSMLDRRMEWTEIGQSNRRSAERYSHRAFIQNYNNIFQRCTPG